jgi:hypothetical protein
VRQRFGQRVFILISQETGNGLWEIEIGCAGGGGPVPVSGIYKKYQKYQDAASTAFVWKCVEGASVCTVCLCRTALSCYCLVPIWLTVS